MEEPRGSALVTGKPLGRFDSPLLVRAKQASKQKMERLKQQITWCWSRRDQGRHLQPSIENDRSKRLPKGRRGALIPH